jgi:hypothetical protein
MLIRDGAVAALSRDSLAHPCATLELGEQVVCPAFVDSHTHILELGLLSLFPDLRRVDALVGAFDLLNAARGRARELGFLLAFNLEPGQLKEKRMPSRMELDRVVPDQPLLVYRIDGHSAALNTRGLRMVLGPDSVEGTELDNGGEPTGTLASLAYERASRAFKRLLPRELKSRAFDRATRVALSKGVLTLGAFVGSDEPGDDIPELLSHRRSQLPVETVVYPQTLSIDRALKMESPRIGGCILIDGSLGSHTAALSADYSDDPGNKGRLYFADAELEDYLRAANAAGLQTAVHAIGDRAVDQVITSYERFLSGNPLRHRIEHAELLSDGLIERIARLGIVLGVQPAFERYWGGPARMYKQRLGERYRKTNTYRQLLDAGVVLAGGSDAPITPIDPEAGIRSAVTHPVPEHRVTALEACRMFTERAAFALGLESKKGSLTPGHDADFLVLDGCPLDGVGFSVTKRFREGRELD